MRTLYSIGIGFYYAGVGIASRFNDKAKQLWNGWHNWRKKVHFDTLGDGKVAWFHASSLGEFEQARPVLEQFRKEHPDFKVCLTFFSPSGYTVRSNYQGADLVMYLPPDTRRNARHLIERMHPNVAFFVKYDFWFNYMEQLSRRHIPFYLFSAIFRPSQYFFRPWGRWFAQQLKSYRHLFVQNDESIQLLNSINVTQCSIAGDTRFDRVHDIAQQAKPNEVVDCFLSGYNGPILIAGSSWEPDEEHIQHFLSSYDSPLKVIIAPHVINERHLTFIEVLYGKDRCVRFSQIRDNATNHPEAYKILIIDNIGLLSALYHYASVAYIGGGFGKGIHNILEAATFGCPTCFGPNYQKFQEAHDLIAVGGAHSYNNSEQLTKILTTWLDSPDAYSQAHQACLQYMEQHLGATSAILEVIETI